MQITQSNRNAFQMYKQQTENLVQILVNNYVVCFVSKTEETHTKSTQLAVYKYSLLLRMENQQISDWFQGLQGSMGECPHQVEKYASRYVITGQMFMSLHQTTYTFIHRLVLKRWRTRTQIKQQITNYQNICYSEIQQKLTIINRTLNYNNINTQDN